MDDHENEKKNGQTHKQKNLTSDTLQAIVQKLLTGSANWVLQRGTITDLAAEFHVNRKAGHNIRKRGL